MSALQVILILCCITEPLHAQVVEKATVFRKFLHGQTTMGFIHAFHHPSDYYLDTTNTNTQGLLAPADFTQLLAAARQRKHHQMKITGVRFAGLMQIAGQQHQYLYCGPTLLIDLNSRVNYWLETAAAAAFNTKSKQIPFTD